MKDTYCIYVGTARTPMPLCSLYKVMCVKCTVKNETLRKIVHQNNLLAAHEKKFLLSKYFSLKNNKNVTLSCSLSYKDYEYVLMSKIT